MAWYKEERKFLRPPEEKADSPIGEKLKILQESIKNDDARFALENILQQELDHKLRCSFYDTVLRKFPLEQNSVYFYPDDNYLKFEYPVNHDMCLSDGTVIDHHQQDRVYIPIEHFKSFKCCLEIEKYKDNKDWSLFESYFRDFLTGNLIIELEKKVKDIHTVKSPENNFFRYNFAEFVKPRIELTDGYTYIGVQAFLSGALFAEFCEPFSKNLK